MDAERFDGWARGLEARVVRRGVGGIMLAALAGFGGIVEGEAKKKKKKKRKKKTCAAGCQDGCCSSTFGQCIRPAQQGGARCGTGGETCHECDSGECRPEGGTCVVNAECCEDFENPLECHDQHCCRAIGHPCETSDGCCPQLICDRSALEPNLACRGTWGAACSDTDNCAEGRTCRRGQCCAAQNMPCEIDDHCCEANELCRVVAVFGPDKVCCLSSGSYCFGIGENQGCCSSVCNEDQTCA